MVCRRQSPRLWAVIGGLVSALGCLFLSFSVQLHQLYISYVAVLSVGTATTLTTASIVVGRYFHKRRECAEMLILTGTGVGMAVVSIFCRQISNQLTWMRTLQGITGLALLTVIGGLFYRSVSLYHPRRKAILHIKNLRKSKKQQREFENKPPYCDISPLRMRSLQLFMLSCSLTAFGMYTPFCLLPTIANDENVAERHVTLLMVFLGVSFAFGALLFGMLTVRSSLRCMVARQYLCQLTGFTAGLSTMLLTLARGFDALALYAVIYGVSCGGYLYSVKVYTYELASLKLSERACGFVALAQAVPAALGPPLTMYLNMESSGALRAGFLIAGSAMGLGAVALCAMPWAGSHRSNHEVIMQGAHITSKTLQDDMVLYGMEVSENSSTPQLLPNGPLTPPPVGRRRSFYGLASSPKVKLYTEVTQPPTAVMPDLGKISEEDRRWHELELSRPINSTDKVTDFLVRSQQMIQDLGSRANVDIPGIQLHITSRYAPEASVTDAQASSSQEAEISDIRLEATVNASPKRKASEGVVNRAMGDSRDGDSVQDITDLTLEATISRPSPKRRRHSVDQVATVMMTEDSELAVQRSLINDAPDLTQGHHGQVCVLETSRPCSLTEDEQDMNLMTTTRGVTLHRSSPRGSQHYVYNYHTNGNPQYFRSNSCTDPNSDMISNCPQYFRSNSCSDPASVLTSNANHSHNCLAFIETHAPPNLNPAAPTCPRNRCMFDPHGSPPTHCPAQPHSNTCNLERLDCDELDGPKHLYDGPSYCGSLDLGTNPEKTTSV